jgi:general secretion pathway protein E
MKWQSTNDLRRLVHDGAEHILREHALAHGMASLRDDGMRLAAQGLTSLEEVVRVTRE